MIARGPGMQTEFFMGFNFIQAIKPVNRLKNQKKNQSYEVN
jgi:hypothetical protein